MTKETEELAAEIEKIDFDGGRAPVGEQPAVSTPAESATPAEPAAKADAPTPEPSEEPAGEPSAATPAEAEPAAPADDKPAIPDSHYRAALHMGWKAEDVAELYDANPDLALKTLSKCYEQVNAASRQLGELGQRARQLRETPVAPAPAAPQPSRRDALLKKLREKYEDDPIIDTLAELIPDQQPAMATRQQPVGQPTVPVADPQVEIEREIAVRQQINTFFGADEMDVYDDFYGKVGQTGTWDTLTPGQKANRIEVCNRAQMILDGAAMTGMQISAAEALERAHLEVAAPIAEQFVRERIVKSVQKRAAGVTLKPSGSKTPASTGYNKEQAVQEMAAELKKVLG